MNAQSVPCRKLFSAVISTLFVTLVIFLAVSIRHAAKAKPLFATIMVNTTADTVAADGACSLREAIQAANTNLAVNECPAGAAGLDTIEFNLGTGTPSTLSGRGNVDLLLTVEGQAATADGYVYLMKNGNLYGARMAGRNNYRGPLQPITEGGLERRILRRSGGWNGAFTVDAA